MNKSKKFLGLVSFFSVALALGAFVGLAQSKSYQKAEAGTSTTWSDSRTINEYINRYATKVHATPTADDTDISVSNATKYSVSVRHGNLSAATLEKFPFSVYTGDYYGQRENQVSAFGYDDGDGKLNTTNITYVRNNYMNSYGNDGCIISIYAKVSLTVTVPNIDLSSTASWLLSGTKVNYWVHKSNDEAGVYTLISENSYSGRPTSFGGLTSYNLSYHDTLYFEFIYNGTDNSKYSERDRENPSNYVGSLTFNFDNNHQMVKEFVQDNMHMTDYDSDLHVGVEGDGWCKDEEHHYYSTAKAAFNALTDDQRELFCTSATFANAYARLRAWAAANSDTFDLNSYTISEANNTLGFVANNHSSVGIIIAIISLTSLVVGFGLSFLLKKKVD